MSQVRQHEGRTMVLEELDLNDADDLREENEDIETRYGAPPASQASRLSFFARPLRSLRTLSEVTPDQFIGYAIVKQDALPGLAPTIRVYESVLRPSRHVNNFIHGEQRWECCIGGEHFQVGGYLYAQQNDMTNVCAHVALRTVAARFHAQGDMSYREMNSLKEVGVDHVKRKVGGPDGGGLSLHQMVAILNAAGARCVIGNYTRMVPEGLRPPPYQKYLYGSIESGYPAIVFFGTARRRYHTIPLFGHTFNEDTWVPSAELSYFKVGKGTKYIPSESWLSTYLAHDDNWGSNFCIPRNFLYARRPCYKWPAGPQLCTMEMERVAYVIATLPKDVKVNPISAEVIGADYLFSMLPQLPHYGEPWESRLAECARLHRLVLRPVLIEAQEYVRHLARLTDWQGQVIDKDLLGLLGASLQGKLWMIELSVPELFSANKRKLGEVLILAGVDPGTVRDFRAFELARLPGCFVLYAGGGPAKPNFTFIPSGARGHVELYGCEESGPKA